MKVKDVCIWCDAEIIITLPEGRMWICPACSGPNIYDNGKGVG